MEGKLPPQKPISDQLRSLVETQIKLTLPPESDRALATQFSTVLTLSVVAEAMTAARDDYLEAIPEATAHDDHEFAVSQLFVFGVLQKGMALLGRAPLQEGFLSMELFDTAEELSVVELIGFADQLAMNVQEVTQASDTLWCGSGVSTNHELEDRYGIPNEGLAFEQLATYLEGDGVAGDELLALLNSAGRLLGALERYKDWQVLTFAEEGSQDWLESAARLATDIYCARSAVEWHTRLAPVYNTVPLRGDVEDNVAALSHDVDEVFIAQYADMKTDRSPYIPV